MTMMRSTRSALPTLGTSNRVSEPPQEGKEDLRFTRGDTKPDRGQNPAPEPPQDGKKALRSNRKVTQPEQGQVPRCHHTPRHSLANHTRSKQLKRMKITKVRFNRSLHALCLLAAVLCTQMSLVRAGKTSKQGPPCRLKLDLPVSGTKKDMEIVSFKVKEQASNYQAIWKDGKLRNCTLYVQSPVPPEYETWRWVVSIAGIRGHREYRLQRLCGIPPLYRYGVEKYQTVKRDEVPQHKRWRTHPQPIPSEKVEEAEETQPLPRKKEKGFLRRILGI